MIGIIFWKIDGDVLEVNDAFLNILGYSRNNLRIEELSWLRFTPPEYFSVDKKALDEIAETGISSPYEKEIIRVDGSRVPILIGGSRLEGLTDTGVSFVLDISQRKEDERKLRQWADIFQHTGQGLVVNSPGSEILEIINPAFAAMHGYTVEELTGCSLSTVLAPSSLPSFPDHFRLVREKDRFILENLHIRKDGTIFPVLVDATNVKDHTGKTLYNILNFQDITARKQAETEIINALNREKELNELKSRFISLTSHEFRTPLATILSSAELLEYYSHKLPESEKKSLFRQIETATTRMTGLLDDMLTINKSESGKLELNPSNLDLQKFCYELIGEIKLNAGNNYQVVLNNLGGCTNVVMDEKILRHILTNLLGNAIKYSPDGGVVEFSLNCQNQQAIFQVKDYGIGIPEESQKKLFESFHRASNVGNIQGTGLGLSIVKRMVNLSGGEITFNSTVGVGTTFTVVLPLNIAEVSRHNQEKGL
jgi:PAS domain S-box-containing protein